MYYCNTKQCITVIKYDVLLYYSTIKYCKKEKKEKKKKEKKSAMYHWNTE